MFDDFFIRAIVAGLGLAIIAGPLGSFVVWRRMAYFGDSTAHAAILGVALALAFDLSIYAGTISVTLIAALIVSGLSTRERSADTMLGVVAHSALALGLVAISFVPSARVDLGSYLFGDILAVGHSDLIWIWTGAVGIIALLIWRWQRLVTASVNEELAMAAGIDPRFERLVVSIAIALLVAIAIRIVGSLLISAILIIPAAAARRLTTTPERMAALASILAGLSVLAGMQASLWFDTPAGPSIIVAASVFFILFQAIPQK